MPGQSVIGDHLEVIVAVLVEVVAERVLAVAGTAS
jgi:hypothetical protein